MEEPKKTGMNVLKKLKKTSRTERAKSEKAWPGHGGLSRSQSCELPFFAQQQQDYKEELKQSRNAKPKPFRRSRDQTMSCSSYFTEDRAARPYMKGRVLTENAKYLTPEQMHALEIDIFKPLDFYEIWFYRMKARDNGEEQKEEDKFTGTVMNWQDFIAQIRNEP